jgi:hypothetical protein
VTVWLGGLVPLLVMGFALAMEDVESRLDGRCAWTRRASCWNGDLCEVESRLGRDVAGPGR